MVFHPLHSLFTQKRNLTWQESDLRHFVEQWLRDKVRSQALYCERLQNGEAKIRVNSPLLQQEVLLSEFALKTYIEQETGYRLKRLQVIISI